MILHGGDMLKAILFDMDGTLLPMDAEAFTKAYMGSLAKKFAPHGYAPEEMIVAVWRGVAAMVKTTAPASTKRCSGRRLRHGSARG